MEDKSEEQSHREGTPSDKTMSLWEHLSELRKRLFISILAMGIVFCVAFGFSTELLIFLKAPLVKALPPGVSALHFTGPMDVFMASLKLGFLTSVIGSAPIWIFQLWKFVEPALYEKEKKLVLPFTLASIFLFFLGISICYVVMLPLALGYFLELGMQVGTPIITVGDYLSMLIVLMLGFGAVFEIPVVLLLLSFLGLIHSSTLIQNRRFVIVGIFIIAAVLTPPDVISQIIMAIPMYLLFEISVWMMKFVEKKSDPKNA